MKECKSVLIYIAGMLTVVAILVGNDQYNRIVNQTCYEQQPLVELK